MSVSEGLLYKGSFGGESVHTQDHPPVILNGTLESGHNGVELGTLLSLNSSNEFVKYDETEDIVGVCVNPVHGDQNTVSYLRHGTVKGKHLKKADGSAFTDYQLLADIGIFVV